MALELFDLFAGTDTGYLKGCRLPAKQSVPINKIDGPNKQLGISCIAWKDDAKTTICAGCKNGEVYSYNLEDSTCKQIHENQRLISDPPSKVILKDISICKESNIILAFNSGLIKISKKDNIFEVGGKRESDDFYEIQAGEDLYCMDHSLHTPSQIATGGKKNCLKIWDIAKQDNNPIFTAKNVKNDWLNLQVPIWETQVKFSPNEKKVITGTGYSHIRVYDPSSQRRPVIEMKYDEKPITALCLRPGYENQVIVGNTIGSLALLDLRKKGIVKGFKGCKGGVTDIQCHPTKPYFATCGVDRFVNCYEFEIEKKPIYSIYMQSGLNCLLFSPHWSAEGASVPPKQKVIEKDKRQHDFEEDMDESANEQIDDNVDVILGKMDVVKTKKRKNIQPPEKGKKRKSS